MLRLKNSVYHRCPKKASGLGGYYFLGSILAYTGVENKGSTSAHDGSTTEEGALFFLHLATNCSRSPLSAIIKELPFITLDKFVKYYGVSYIGTGINFGGKYSGKQVASLVRGSIMSTKGTPSPHQLRCCKINAGCACSFVGCYRESTSVGAGP